MRCKAPITWEALVDYWAGDMPASETDRVDEHLFGCDACSAESARFARLAQALRSAIPAVISAEQMRDLHARGLVVEENVVPAGARREVVFKANVDIMVHRLGGLDLSQVERVHVTVRSESSGGVMHEEHFAPFDRERGEVLIACQRHFEAMPRDVMFDVHAHHASGASSLTQYFVPHVFPG
jgi:hypothetical protein